VRLARIVLLVLSLSQFILNEAFWAGEFYWLFIWIIAFQIQWFYLEKEFYRKIMLFVLMLLALINVAILPQLPILMLGLLVFDIREEYNRQTTGFISLGLALGLWGVWHYVRGYPSWNTLLILLAVVCLCGWLVEQSLEMGRREAERFERISEQTALEQKTVLLKSQMDAMEEIYTLNERNRISRDLHDSIGHTLSTIVIQLAAIEKVTEKSNPKAAKMLNQLHGFTKEGLSNVREVIHEIKPSNYGRIAFVDRLASLMTEFEANSNLQVYFNTNEVQWRLNEDQEALIYRAVQEFLGNTSKHSDATEIRIQYHFTNDSVILTMQDNGEGTDEIVPQMGLTGMKERANLLGGKVNIRSSLGSGFKVRIVLPKGGFVYDTTID
jgi:signal transduction histidine kinase